MDTRMVQQTSHPELTDGLLVERVSTGDHSAFETLVYRYQAMVYQFAKRCLGESEQAHDVVQFVFLQLYVSIPHLRENPFLVRGNLPLKAWLFHVARNRCADEQRKKRVWLFSELKRADEDEELSLVDSIADPSPLPEVLVERQEVQRQIYEAIKALPPKYRSIVWLRSIEQLRFEEIGKRLKMPESTAKVYFHRARSLLRTALSSYERLAAA